MLTPLGDDLKFVAWAMYSHPGVCLPPMFVLPPASAPKSSKVVPTATQLPRTAALGETIEHQPPPRARPFSPRPRPPY